VDFPAPRNVPRRREFSGMNIESFSRRRTHYANYACLHPRMPNDSIRECNEIRGTNFSFLFLKNQLVNISLLLRYEYFPAFLRRSK